MYMINAATGTVFMLILMVFAVIRHDMLMTYLEMLPSRFTPYVGGAAALAVACLASFNIMSAPSISLEGKNLWIAKSLPVKPVRILMAKVNMHIVTRQRAGLCHGFSAEYPIAYGNCGADFNLFAAALL